MGRRAASMGICPSEALAGDKSSSRPKSCDFLQGQPLEEAALHPQCLLGLTPLSAHLARWEVCFLGASGEPPSGREAWLSAFPLPDLLPIPNPRPDP